MMQDDAGLLCKCFVCAWRTEIKAATAPEGDRTNCAAHFFDSLCAVCGGDYKR